ncbi:flavodoxin domain-containing protein [Akkermansiaceae bacterium]|nr:flavodoxin domain-containing protein [Akkermansiaceae bacterium]
MSDNLQNVILPEDAPFSPEQREWLNGYLTGLLAPYAGGSAEQKPGLPVTIITGSQTGTAEGLAKKFSKKAKSSGIDPTIVSAADYDFSKLPTEKHVLIVTSTYGDGEPPDNMLGFYNAIHAEDAPSLAEVNYSILSIGDSSYPDFCQCGTDLDKKFLELGATAVAPRVDCDLELDEDFAAWTDSVLTVLGSVSTDSDADDDEEESGYTKKNPFTSKLLVNKNLNHAESSKATHHLEFCLKDSGLVYEAGDALGIYPVNDPALVDAFDALIDFDFTDDFKELLLKEYEIKNLTIPVLKSWAEKTGSGELQKIAEDKKATASFLWGRDIIDMQRDYPIAFTDESDFLSVLKKVAPRLYSISSSPKAHPDEVHLTVGYVEYESNGEIKKGICSSYLADRCDDQNPPRVFMHSNKAFRPPVDPKAPMIMVGPGTGIAPFRAFLEERAATKAEGDNWLFFGNPHVATDFLYQDELKQFQSDGYLSKLSTAFSRDQEKKIYVQDKIIEHGEELYAWLENDGHFYVCGDASRMAKDVETALHKIIEDHGKMTPEEAIAYVNKMKTDKRYARDVY